MTQPAPGWYSTMNAPEKERWWDGTAWTEHFRASNSMHARPEPKSATATVHRALALDKQETKNSMATAGLILGILAALFNYLFVPSILAYVFSGIGLFRANKLGLSGRRKAVIGIVLASCGVVISVLQLAYRFSQYSGY
ncbi:DUF2510 domain-containing protein [Cryobacterium sp. Sr8]|uniref:DUF2510 domain-containing protein n=1 Tax=Cryobacterium sp. Sr8 TaxID=1259203 RepID=UPI0010695F9A|nr:DUF2510 domain-containing protein [Cryobacterium sp. Sr8]TFD78781.1 DUF2510 domain-containing protein [Cryobacterium sp. Sr8]